MGDLALAGATSGTITLTPTAVAGSNTLTLPAATGTILTTASSGQIIPKAALPTGSVLQVVSTTKTDAFSTSSGSFVDITGMTASITPTSSSSKILVIVNMSVFFNNVYCQINLLRNSTNICQPTVGTNPVTTAVRLGSQIGLNACITFLDSPATTSSTAYKLQMTSSGGNTTYINRDDGNANNSCTSTITVMEIAA